MDKKERMKLCKELCYKADYEILDGTHEYPKHIRLNGIGDIWPTTGTLKLNGSKAWFKKDRGVYKLAEILEKSIPKNVKPKLAVRMEHLESQLDAMFNQVKELTECMESVMHDIELLK